MTLVVFMKRSPLKGSTLLIMHFSAEQLNNAEFDPFLHGIGKITLTKPALAEFITLLNAT
ncbi:MAG: hypothetical protein ACPG8W_23630 [Candidatus Promineifilaceae bacterium]